MRRSSIVLSSLLVLGCGPLVPSSDDTGNATGESTGDDTGPVATTAPPPPTGPATSTSTTATTTASTEDSGDETGSFIMPTDGGVCVVSDDGFWHCTWCDLFAQDCPLGEKCMPWANDGGSAWNATRCTPIVEDPGDPGDPCTVEDSPVSGFDTCALGAMCWDVNPMTLEGTCVAMCTGSEAEPVCPAQNTCLITNDGAISVCLPDCDPLLGNCEPFEACAPFNDSFICVPSTDDAPAGAPCEYLGACEVGSVCLPSDLVGGPCDLGAFGCCTPWCDLEAPDPTAGCLDPGQVCAPWWDGEPAPAGLEHVGACALP